MPSGRRHYRITLANALEAHDAALTRGGAPGVLSQTGVESAIGRPYTGYYPSIAAKCAALTESVCRNHGFTDGNKRTCVLLVGMLLERSGYELVPLPDEDIDDALEALAVHAATGEWAYAALHTWYRARIKRRPRRKRRPLTK